MGRLTNEARQEKARKILYETIAKIEALEPALGEKWRAGMLAYYRGRLAELVLRQAGFSHPTDEALRTVVRGIGLSLELSE